MLNRMHSKSDLQVSIAFGLCVFPAFALYLVFLTSTYFFSGVDPLQTSRLALHHHGKTVTEMGTVTTLILCLCLLSPRTLPFPPQGKKNPLPPKYPPTLVHSHPDLS